MTANMYRVGDCVYFETSSTLPYQIRRIEELNKTASGNVEAKVMCFYRRRDLPSPLIQLADKHQMAQSEDSPVAMKLKKMWLKTPVGEEQAAQAVLDPAIVAMEEEQEAAAGNNGTGAGAGAGAAGGAGSGGTVGVGVGATDGPQSRQRHQMKHRELFLSRHVETLPATHIRGKCSVTLLNETESLLSYLNKDDTFFYCLVFDPTQKTLLADKGEIRVGSRYQTEMTTLLKEGEEDPRRLEDLETLVWTPEHGLTDRQIDQFLVVSRSVGTFARALDCSSSVKQPSLHMSAAAASRDITLFHAMDTLHRHEYCLEAALSSLVPPSGPVLCRDEMEEWSASEANLFEEALDKYGKDFNDIRTDFLPWKTLKNIVEYYYMWKTTDRYVQQKRVKAVEAESKLKQVYIPNYNKPNPAIISNNKSNNVMNGGTNGSAVNLTSGEICSSCQATSSQQWYAWGPSQLQSRLCSSCWQYWKKYGGFKFQSSGVCEGEPETLSLTSSAVPGANAGGSARVRGPLSGGRSSDGEDQPASGVHSAFSHRPHRCSMLNCGKEFKLKAQLARHYAAAHGAAMRAGSPRPVMKTRAAFYLRTSPLTRLARRLSRALRRPRRIARAPFNPVNIHQVKHDCSVGMAGLSPAELSALTAGRGGRARGSVTRVAERLAGVSPAHGQGAQHAWLRLTPKDRMPQPVKVAFPKPQKAPDGSLMYERVPNKGEVEGIRPAPGTSPSPALKRRYDDLNGVDRGAGDSGVGGVGGTTGAGSAGAGGAGAAGVGAEGARCAPPPAKRPNKHPQPMQRPSAEQYAAMCARAQATGQPLPKHIFAHVNGKPGLGGGGRGRRHVISWMDAPDDLYFRVTDQAKARRRLLSIVELRRAARKPWRTVGAAASGGKGAPLQVVILD